MTENSLLLEWMQAEAEKSPVPQIPLLQDPNLKRELRQLGHTKGKKKPLGDAYITPPVAIEELLSRERFEGKGWEPACGSGAIVKYFPGIMASDIREDPIIIGEKGIDFLWTYRKVNFIVTNPPYSIGLQFARHAVECADKVAMLMRIQFLESKARYKFFRNHPPKRIYIFADRIMCIEESLLRSKRPNCVMMFAWFVWEKNPDGTDYQGKPNLDWILTGRVQNEKDMLR